MAQGKGHGGPTGCRFGGATGRVTGEKLMRKAGTVGSRRRAPWDTTRLCFHHRKGPRAVTAAPRRRGFTEPPEPGTLTFRDHTNFLGPGGIRGVEEQESSSGDGRGPSLCRGELSAMQRPTEDTGVPRWEPRAAVPAMLPAAWPSRSRGRGVMRGDLEKGTAWDGELRAALESRSRGWGGSGGGGLRLCRLRKKLSPGTQDSGISVSCRCLCSGCLGTLLLCPCLY